MTHVGGAYSHALPGHAAAREDLAHPFEQRLFFAGEATHVHDYSTAHGAHDSGLRAAEEAIAALTSVAGMNATKSGSSGSSQSNCRASNACRSISMAKSQRHKAIIRQSFYKSSRPQRCETTQSSLSHAALPYSTEAISWYFRFVDSGRSLSEPGTSPLGGHRTAEVDVKRTLQIGTVGVVKGAPVMRMRVVGVPALNRSSQFQRLGDLGQFRRRAKPSSAGARTAWASAGRAVDW